MAKVKRKQIEYEGKVTQFVKGNGSLGNIDDINGALVLEYNLYSRTMSGATLGEIYTANENKKPVFAIVKTEDPSRISVGTYSLIQATHNTNRDVYFFHFVMVRPTASGSIPFGYIYFDGSEWSAYSGYFQRQLVSSGQYQNIKTINNQSLLGTGNIEITFQDTNTQYLLDIETQSQTASGATIKKYVIKLKDKDTEEVVSSVTVPIWGTRTINGENIIQKVHAAGDINLHDGYYFPNAVKDNDGNWYGAVIIGNQVWLGENYRSKTFRDGTAIQHYEQGLDPSIPWYYDGPENEDELKKHGLSYNWAAISKTTSGSNSELIQQLTIDGWHIPTDDDFIELFNYTGDQTRYNSVGLETNMHLFASVEEWTVNNVSPFTPVQIAKLNATGFSAYPTIGTSYCRFMTTTVSDGNYVSYLCNLEDSNNKQFHKVAWNSAPTQMWVRLLCDKTPAEFRAWYVAQYGTMQHVVQEERELDIRTISHEQITDASLGNINIHDGFYFPNAVQDIDGNWYGAVVIGDQVWMGENFRCTSLPDGTPIVNGSPSANGGVENYDLLNPRYYYPHDDENSVEKIGLLYNWQALSNQAAEAGVMQGIAPTGWHIPMCNEYDQLLRYVTNQKRYVSAAPYDEQYPDDHAYTTNSLFAESSNGDAEKVNATGFNWKTVAKQYTNGNVTDTAILGIFLATSDYHNIVGENEAIKCCVGEENIYVSTDDGLNIRSNTPHLGISVRCVSDLTPIQFRNWYIKQYGSLQHHLPQEIPTIPTPFFYGYTNTTESTSTKVVTLAEPTTGFKNGTYIMVYFAGGGVPAGNSNAISIGNDVYYLAYKARGITQAGIINQGDKVLLWCHNGFAHVISNDRWSLPTITAADEGKILKVVNGALALVTP